MDAHCYHYNLGLELDLKKLEGVEDLTKINGTNILRTQYGDVSVLVFPDGEIRTFIKGKKIELLKEALLSAGVKILGLLQAIKKKGYDFDEQKVFSGGKQMLFEYNFSEGARPKMSKNVIINILREIVYGPYDIMPKFQIERNMVQAGENIGRKLVNDKKFKDLKEVSVGVNNYLNENQIGLSSYSTKKISDSSYDLQVFTLYESAFSAGMPQVNEPLDHFVRGFIRGAISQFLELENISVKETHCWGLGDTFCTFEAKVFPK